MNNQSTSDKIKGSVAFELEWPPTKKQVIDLGNIFVDFWVGLVLPPTPIAAIYLLVLRLYFSAGIPMRNGETIFSIISLCNTVLFFAIAWVIRKRVWSVSNGMIAGIFFAGYLVLIGSHLFQVVPGPFYAGPPSNTIW